MRTFKPRRGARQASNQPPPLEGYNLFEQDAVLREAVEREAGSWGLERLGRFGEKVGGEPLRFGALANQNPPVLRTHDRYGNRIDEVQFHPAWTELLRLGIREEIPSLPWRDPRPGAHVVRGALMMLISQAEAGVGCPLSMTYASVPALRENPSLAAQWEPRVLDDDPDRSALIGMAMTESQGGSDVKANTTRAQWAADGTYRITGHKWFCSHPVSDAFLITAQALDGLSCFFVPRRLPDGSINGWHLQRLKDKLGTRALATAEVDIDAAVAWLVGEEGRGLPTIMRMVTHTRLDCALGSAAGMRRAVAEATHHAAYREAFGKTLIDQPLMQNVLADLCVESEATTLLAMRVARSFDLETESGFRRLATPIAKYWISKRAVSHVAEALESLGGNGYIEEFPLARMLRDAPVNTVWEGPGNVIALDTLRAMAREPSSLEAVMAEAELARGMDPRLDRALSALRGEIEALARAPETASYLARRVAERLALALQGSLVLRHSPWEVAEAFLATRIGGDRRLAFGTLPSGIDCDGIVERHRPKLRAGPT